MNIILFVPLVLITIIIRRLFEIIKLEHLCVSLHFLLFVVEKPTWACVKQKTKPFWRIFIFKRAYKIYSY